MTTKIALGIVMVLTLVACGAEVAATSDGGRDAGTDGGRDAGPTCTSFAGAYGLPRTETCLRATRFAYGTMCLTQNDRCEVLIAGSLGNAAGNALGDVLRFEVDGLTCVARRQPSRALDLECTNGAGTLVCDTTLNASRSLDRACCASDAECESGDRCAPVSLGLDAPAPIVSACVNVGTGARGALCASGASGIDSCGAGLTCVSGSLGADMLICRPICRNDGECAADETCRWYALTSPPIGYCVPGCAVGGGECAMGESCDTAPAIDGDGDLADGLACRAVGTTPEGDTCTRSSQCVVDTTCARAPGAPTLTCLPICDATHPCPTATDTCYPDGAFAMPPSGFCAP